MDHREAIQTGLAERYVLGELSDAESADFERHFFDCTECAEEVRVAALFADNAKAVFAEDGPPAEGVEWPRGAVRGRPPQLRWWRRPWSAAPAFAAAALLVVVAYQSGVQIPALRRELREALSPQPIASYRLLRGSRGDTSVFHVPPGARFAVAMDPDPAWTGSIAEYWCSLEDESGSTRFSKAVPARPGKEIELLMPASLPAGKYTVVLRSSAGAGQPGAELARYALILN